jgi:glycosyltransferase involved in cell wall biosynthesis
VPRLAELRVALVHDWLTGMRGGERCLEDFCRVLPGAHIYTLFHFPGSVSPEIEALPIHTARRFRWVARIPGARRRYRWLLPLFPGAAARFDLRGYNLVFSSSHCVAKGAGEGQGVPRIAYLHTPMRYIWDQAQIYFNRDRFSAPALRAIEAVLARLRRWDISVHPDRYIANSDCVAERIRRIYGREARVIRPPVDLDRLPEPSGESRGDHYLIVSALAPYKRVADAIDACRALGRRLVVIGTGEDEARLRARSGPDVEFRGWVSDGDVAAAYRAARAVLMPGEEDFGIVPLEAMASGAPVIALGKGGATETVVDLDASAAGRSPTGVLYPEPGAEPLAAAIRRFEATARRFDPKELRGHAALFGRPRFRKEITEALEEFIYEIHPRNR